MCLNIWTPTTNNFPFATNGKLMVLGVPIHKHFTVFPFSVLLGNMICSLPGQSPGRAIVLPPASVLELVSALAAAALAKC